MNIVTLLMGPAERERIERLAREGQTTEAGVLQTGIALYEIFLTGKLRQLDAAGHPQAILLEITR